MIKIPYNGIELMLGLRAADVKLGKYIEANGEDSVKNHMEKISDKMNEVGTNEEEHQQLVAKFHNTDVASMMAKSEEERHDLTEAFMKSKGDDVMNMLKDEFKLNDLEASAVFASLIDLI